MNHKEAHSENAKMLMPTFTRGYEVGLFKQRGGGGEVKKRISHSLRVSEVYRFVNRDDAQNNSDMETAVF